MIELENVSVEKAKTRLLKNINLFVGRNEFLGIIGPNGAGKTTLLNVISGFEKYAGRMRLFGRPVSGKYPREIRIRIGYVPQLFEIDPAFPILAVEAVMTGLCGRLGLFHSPTGADHDRAMELLEIMRVAHLARRPLGHLSGGERQKVSIARAIIQRPDVLLLDEPTANLDIAVQKEVFNLIEKIHETESPAVLFVTHDFNMLPESMARMVFLNNGGIVYDGESRHALTSARMTGLFEYPLEMFERNGRRFISFG
ncbi:MAG TPA: metal ABC transporter ATP-binding protein [Acidobacteriota bacterium]|nr:metal ABC transporter ATP-binding protein [Acidobacteriota bacterium]